MIEEETILSRTRLLAGDKVMNAISDAHVIVIGVGGVGSWCVESLVRSGIRHITIVDSDTISATNINRQLPATTSTVGKSKVEVMKERMLDINPYAEVTALQTVYSEETAPSLNIGQYDYIIDAIDSLKYKIQLINEATRTDATFFSSMGAALKISASRIAVAEFWKVKGCPLARAIRTGIKRSGVYPAKKFKCVYSDELLENAGEYTPETHSDDSPDWNAAKARINGTFAHTTAIFGFTLAGLVIEDIYARFSK